MSQKSSVPQAISFVSQVLKRDMWISKGILTLRSDAFSRSHSQNCGTCSRP